MRTSTARVASQTTYQNGYPDKRNQQCTTLPCQYTKPSITTGEVGIPIGVVAEGSAAGNVHDPIKDGRKQSDSIGNEIFWRNRQMIALIKFNGTRAERTYR